MDSIPAFGTKSKFSGILDWANFRLKKKLQYVEVVEEITIFCINFGAEQNETERYRNDKGIYLYRNQVLTKRIVIRWFNFSGQASSIELKENCVAGGLIDGIVIII